MDEMGKTKTGSTKVRHDRAMKDKAFDLIRNMAILETRAEHFLRVLQAGKVSTNVFLRRIHNFALDMNWLPWGILPKKQWPKVKFKDKRAITLEEHQRVIAAEGNLERKAFYQLCWHLGAIRADFEECREYWLTEFPNLSENTRSIIVLTFSMLVRPLITRPLRQIFSADTNIRPEDTFDGKIIIINIPVQEFRLVGRIANLAFKYCFQIAVLRRVQPADRKSFLRPVFLWADEAQQFVTRFDPEYQAVARSAGGCTV